MGKENLKILIIAVFGICVSYAVYFMLWGFPNEYDGEDVEPIYMYEDIYLGEDDVAWYDTIEYTSDGTPIYSFNMIVDSYYFESVAYYVLEGSSYYQSLLDDVVSDPDYSEEDYEDEVYTDISCIYTLQEVYDFKDDYYSDLKDIAEFDSYLFYDVWYILRYNTLNTEYTTLQGILDELKSEEVLDNIAIGVVEAEMVELYSSILSLETGDKTDTFVVSDDTLVYITVYDSAYVDYTNIEVTDESSLNNTTDSFNYIRTFCYIFIFLMLIIYTFDLLKILFKED